MQTELAGEKSCQWKDRQINTQKHQEIDRQRHTDRQVKRQTGKQTTRRETDKPLIDKLIKYYSSIFNDRHYSLCKLTAKSTKKFACQR